MYALGLRIQGMTRDQLLENIRVDVQDSGTASHPETSANMEADFVLLGGGFKAEYTGPVSSPPRRTVHEQVVDGTLERS
jgi:hypothetical protein